MKRSRPSGLLGTLARLFAFTRFIAELGVLSSAVLSLALFALSILRLWPTLVGVFSHFADDSSVKKLLVSAVEQADVLLVATALLIISIGLQALFVGQSDQLPGWLHIATFDDLKQKLLGVVAAALAVRFFSAAVDWHGEASILPLGLATALVMLAIAANVLVNAHKGRAEAPTDEPADG